MSGAGACGCATACGCCAGTALLTPAPVDNRPGLPRLAYRVGTHGRFKASMLAGIAARPALSALTTRRDDDLSVALIDGWASMLDILTFYQQLIANEGFLRTAAERRSLLELARAIGYELRPGVAATTFLAFTVEGKKNPAAAPGTLPPAGARRELPAEVTIPAGTRAQSVPGPGERPQPFETAEPLAARPEWNAMAPRRHRPQLLAGPIGRLVGGRIEEVVFAGTETGLAVGDRVLAVQDGVVAEKREVFRVASVAVDRPPPATGGTGRTRVALVAVDPPSPRLEPAYVGVPAFLPPAPPGPLPFTADNVKTYLLGKPSWTAGDLAARLDRLGWSEGELADHLAALPRPRPTTTLRFYALRVKAPIFGHNAPRWGTLPVAWRDTDVNSEAPYPQPWDVSESDDVIDDSQGVLHDGSGRVFFLDQAQPAIVADSWLVLEGRSGGQRVARAYRVESASETSRADFGIAGKATRIAVTEATASDLREFEVRDTTAWAASDELPLADLPIAGDVAGLGVELDGFAIGLAPGRAVAVEGVRADLPGVEAAEVRELAEVTHSMETGVTRLTFTAGLAHRYLRATVRVRANVARATHGETRREVLGSGDAAQPFQRFALKQKPLTHVPAAVASGGESTLELRVNDIRWHESPDLYRLGSDDRAYVLRRGDDGTTRVLFGDGERGARLPTGRENLTAVYRIGVGLAGHVEAGRISLLATRPLGVQEVANPVAAAGGADPEERDAARRNAPLTVRTLDRVVSLADFEDFARAFSGIGKARADWLWDGRRRVVHLTVAGADGAPLADDAPLVATLIEAIDRLREPFQPVVVGAFEPLGFQLAARLAVHRDHREETVFAAAAAAVAARFGFAARGLARPVAASEVVAALHEAPGVEAVDLDALAVVPAAAGAPALPARLLALPARLGPLDPATGRRPVRGAQLLTLAPQGVALEPLR